MADETIDPKNIAEYQKALDELIKKASSLSTDELNKKMQVLQESAKKFGEVGKKAFEAFQKQIAETAKAIQSLDPSEIFKGLSKSLEISQEEVEKFAKGVGSALITYKKLQVLPKIDFASGLGSSSAGLNDLSVAAENFTTTLKNVLPESEALNKSLDAIKSFAAAEQRVNKMSQALLAAAASSGNLSEYLDQVSDASGRIDFSKVESKLVTLNELNYKVATSTGMNAASVRNLANLFQSTMPRALDESNAVNVTHLGVVGNTKSTYNMLEASMRVSMGTMQEASTVQEYVNSSFHKFNLTGQEALENFAAIATNADKLNLPFNNLKSYIDNTSGSFMYFKDNTQALINVMGRLAPAFKAAKLSPEAITDLTRTMVNNINGMALAQRSFLSMQSGGAGGLRGGYEIELLKAQGKFDEIQKKTEQALKKQFGGRVVTLEEASRDEGAARQLAKQVQLVTSGPTKVVESEAQAYKLFEAMRTGVTGTAEKGQESLSKVMDNSYKVQETQTSVLVDINNEIERVAVNTDIMAKRLSGDVSGAVRAMYGAGKTKLAEKFPGGFDSRELSRSASSKEAARMTVYTDRSSTAAQQLTLEQKSLFEPTVVDKMLSGFGAEVSKFMGGLFGKEEKTLPKPEIESVEIPELEPFPMLSPEQRMNREIISLKAPAVPGAAAANEPVSSSHQVTINLQTDSKQIETIALNIMNGQMSIERQNSTLGAAIVPNP